MKARERRQTKLQCGRTEFIYIIYCDDIIKVKSKI